MCCGVCLGGAVWASDESPWGKMDRQVCGKAG